MSKGNKTFKEDAFRKEKCMKMFFFIHGSLELPFQTPRKNLNSINAETLKFMPRHTKESLWELRL